MRHAQVYSRAAGGSTLRNFPATIVPEGFSLSDQALTARLR
jgi:hypothetical protein